MNIISKINLQLRNNFTFMNADKSGIDFFDLNLKGI